MDKTCGVGRGMMRSICLIGALCICGVSTHAQVRVWEGTLKLPTYQEGPPDTNPPFDLLAPSRGLSYPYTLRDNLTAERKMEVWRAIFLENEYLKCVVLPDVGGHVYNCTDKVNGKDLFYANTSLKKASIAIRGAWAAFGDEFNFPVSHNWVSLSPVDYATRTNKDGSAAVIVGNVDRVYGMQWEVELTLRPGSTVLEQKTTLSNPGDIRHRFYWWNNAAIRVWDDSKIWYPMAYVATHGFTRIDHWPVDTEGHDLSVIREHVEGPVSKFVYGSREPYMGIYNPHTDAGTVHYANIQDQPAKKIWSWGVDADGLDWRNTLSDDDSAYVEIQAGLFRNQETYSYLEPQESVQFNEYFFPVRGLGGISRANLNATAYFLHEKSADGHPQLRININVTHSIPNATVRVVAGKGNDLLEERTSLSPSRTATYLVRTTDVSQKCKLTITDSTGKVIFEHTEGEYDIQPESQIPFGPQPSYQMPPASVRNEDDFLQAGDDLERNGQRISALENYRLGLARFSQSFGLNKAAGRLAVDLARYEEANSLLERALPRTNNDAEIQYYLGLAKLASGDERMARTYFEQAQLPSSYATAARIQLAQMDARDGNLEQALRQVQSVITTLPTSIRAARIEIALLRRLGRLPEAHERVKYWRVINSADTQLRIEASRLGGQDPELRAHLASDPERVLAAAIADMEMGDYQHALTLLADKYPDVSPLTTELGAVLPQNYPLVIYYRGFCREKLHQSGLADYTLASQMPTTYVFPSRASTYGVLRRALEANPKDAHAHFFMGDLYLAGGRADKAVEEWQAARQLDANIPTLHRNLGLTLLQLKREPGEALATFKQGIEHDNLNPEVYEGACRAEAALAAPADECVRLIQSFPDQHALAPRLVLRLALSLAQGGKFTEAESLFHNRFFPRQEGGVTVQQIFLEVELTKIQEFSRAGRRAEARAAIDSLGHSVEGTEFTPSSLEPFLQTPRFQYLLGRVEALLGNDSDANKHWRASLDSGKDKGGIDVAYAYLAARRLNDSQADSLHRRLSAILQSLTRAADLDATTHYEIGFLLSVQGDENDAQQEYVAAVCAPISGLSWYFSERALRTTGVKDLSVAY